MIPQPALPIWAIIAVLLLIRTDVSARRSEDSQLLLGYGRDDYERGAEDVILRVTAVLDALGIKRDGDRSIFYVAPD